MNTRRVSSLSARGAMLAAMIATLPVLAADETVLTASKAYLAPELPPLTDARIVIRDGQIAAVGTGARPPKEAASGCDGGIVTAGFQNSHVHLIGEDYFGAEAKSAVQLSGEMTRMFTRFGYTTVVDTTSEPANAAAIRRRIESGEVAGPRILTVGAGVFPPAGLPVYISHLPRQFLDAQLMPATAEEARLLVRKNLAGGAEALKLFVATPQADGSLKRMSLEVARAAVEAAHEHNRLAMVHPTDSEGVRLALAAGADVLVHTTLGEEAPWPQDMLKALLAADVAIAPTLKLLRYELNKERVPEEIATRLIATTVENFKPFVAGGGTVVFGTDVGYMSDVDPREEYELMQKAGMTPMQILASLTTQPARLWKEQGRRGRIEVGMDADLVVLRADPVDDVRSFADVRCAIRGGRVIYRD